ncbi:replication protein [Sporosarcina sp. ANT_H38]|uniref:conserved phage C-terminal domain-containing protein n=1 Tax=Sporosarcina sp. ANT_H38 TaxID=2597358 RepID=UPI0011F0F4B4|nr:conserved phage C-terminal domain-containing protein [Sporosarcina sp. ANT_H38]KAA0944176.1 replication protein [Sporosarcina sp. ANT_H38]
MSNYQAIRELLKRVSGQDNVFTVPRLYVQYAGDLTTAILLNQIVFYSDKSKRKDGFFYKTYKEWDEEICLTERQVRYSINKLKNIGIVETKLKKANGAPTVHYKLDYDKFVESILTFCQIPFEQSVGIHSDNLSESLTEITTENTTETTTETTTLIDNVTNVPSHPFQEIVSYLNDKAKTNYRANGKKTQSLIKARMNEGFHLDDFKKVIDNKSSQWLGVTKWESFLRPETLFGNKFEGYLNEKGGTSSEATSTTKRSDPKDDEGQSRISETNERRKRIAGIQSNRDTNNTI